MCHFERILQLYLDLCLLKVTMRNVLTHSVLLLWYQMWKWADAGFPKVSSVVLVIILRASLCVHVCVCTAVSFPSCHVYFCIVCFWIPLRCAFHSWTTRQSGALWGLEWERKRERDEGTLRKSKRETEEKGEEDREEKKSFERLLTSKLTAIAALARGESTSKHTGWVMMWSDYKSKVIHNKQCSPCQLTYMRLVLRGKKWKHLKGQQRPRVKEGLLLSHRCQVDNVWS